MKKIFKNSLIFFNYLFELMFKKNLFHFINEHVNENAYKKIIVKKKPIKFFIPNFLVKWRIQTFYTKEPETLRWIDNFNGKKIVFWDVGANIGLYSIYASIVHKKIKTIAFEPSTLNLRILSTNISKNNLHDKISICQIALNDKKNVFLTMHESSNIEGAALNTFGNNLDFEGKKISTINKYKIFGTSIDSLLKDKSLTIPNYIKIDVDGIEHLILKGGIKYLKSKKVKSISVELNENYKTQLKFCTRILENLNFQFIRKEHSGMVEESKDYNKTYNFIFNKKNI